MGADLGWLCGRDNRRIALAALPWRRGLHRHPTSAKVCGESMAMRTRNTRIKKLRLSDTDLSTGLSKDQYRKRSNANQIRLVKLLSDVISKGLRVIVAMEGWDAAGKGGAIRRMVKNLDPRHYSVYSIAKPTQEELERHYLWRFWRRVPGCGHIAIFDRSWYGRVLVERIEGFASKDEWQRGFGEINEFERHLVDDGYILIKLFLHIDDETQKKRFLKRESDPLKRWKLNDEDYRNRKKRGKYQVAIDETFAKTHTAYAPWQIIPANDKYMARIATQDALIDAVEAHLSRKRGKRR